MTHSDAQETSRVDSDVQARLRADAHTHETTKYGEFVLAGAI